MHLVCIRHCNYTLGHLMKLTTCDVFTPGAGNTLTYCLLTTSTWPTWEESRRNHLFTWLQTQAQTHRCKEDTVIKTISASHQASTQVVMHKILPGDLDSCFSKVKVQES